MTPIEISIRSALQNCTFLPGSFDKRFVMNLQADKPMTEKGRAFMITCFHKYRRQIKNYQQLSEQLNVKAKV